MPLGLGALSSPKAGKRFQGDEFEPKRMTSAFEDHVLQLAVAAVGNVPAAQRADTYAMSFFVYDDEDDPRRPTLTIGTNTEARVLASTSGSATADPIARPAPTDPEEARWNYAFWLQNQLVVVGDQDGDPPGALLRQEWVRSLGLWYEDPSSDVEWRDALAKDKSITGEFVKVCVKTARSLHARGLVESVFGRPIPVIVHELEYYEPIVDQTLRANPPGLADEFARWVSQSGSP